MWIARTINRCSHFSASTSLNLPRKSKASITTLTAIEAWAKPLVDKHTPAEIAAFNESRVNWAPDGHSQAYFDTMKADVAPGRSDVTTWFKLLDLDEKRAA